MEKSRAALVLSELTHAHSLGMKLSAHLDHPSQIEVCRSIAREVQTTIRAAKLRCLTQISEPSAKKRKMLPKRTDQVSVIYVEGVEVVPDDGHSWRKYGQKEILGAKHPRAYYRCTHNKTQGCSAMKQMQRSDENSSYFHVTYRGDHTCSSSQLPLASTQTTSPLYQQMNQGLPAISPFSFPSAAGNESFYNLEENMEFAGTVRSLSSALSDGMISERCSELDELLLMSSAMGLSPARDAGELVFECEGLISHDMCLDTSSFFP